ncbi:MAG TPA: hypothetical protein VF498_05335 [Anaerolineales bacterium]
MLNLHYAPSYPDDVLELFELWDRATPGTRRRAYYSKIFLKCWHTAAGVLPWLGVLLLAATLVALLSAFAEPKTLLLVLLGAAVLGLIAGTRPAIRLVDSLALCCLEFAFPE